MADFQVVGARNREREDLRTVAVYQKGVIICILIQFLAIVGWIVLAAYFSYPLGITETFQVASKILGLMLLAASLVAMVLTFLLSLKVYTPTLGIPIAMLALVPGVGLIALLMVNGRATFVLRKNGHKVRLFGASLSEMKDSLQAGVDLASPHPNPLPEGEGAAKEPL